MRERVPNGPVGEDSTRGGDRVDQANLIFSKGAEGRVDRDESEAPAGSAPTMREKSGAPDRPLEIARNMYEDSTSYMDSSLRDRWERAERAFQNRHPPGSKYFAEAYKTKSKLFRPKTRSMIRSGEADAAASFFSNDDPTYIEPLNPDDPQQVASAALWHEVMRYRLSSPNPRVGVPWFQTVIGGYQNAQKYGCVISKQFWDYVTVEYRDVIELVDETTGEPILDPETGKPIRQVMHHDKVVVDKPECVLVPPENLRLDRGADWRDPINTSPFLVHLTPMYLFEIEQRMKQDNPLTGEPMWLEVPQSDLLAATSRHSWDSTRAQREGNREDSKDSQIAITEYQMVWVHENIARWNDIDWVWYTAGVHALLSEPVPLLEVYPHLRDYERPYTMGVCLIEANKTWPWGKVDLVAQLQAEANELVNTRIDNLKLALNKRYLVRRGAQADLQSLLRNSAGGVTLVSDTERDVKVMETRDVTAGSYQEQDRINLDFDETGGIFSPGSVQSNRKLNETVGGMQMLGGAANKIGELDLKVFATTWVQPTLQQIVRMEQFYENDLKLLTLGGKKAKLVQKFGIDEITDELLTQDITVRCNVGIGATDPQQRLQKFQAGAAMLGEIFGPQIMQFAKHEEIINEVMGLLGYGDGSRFFDFEGQDPRIAMLQKQIEELQQMLESQQMDNETKIKVAEIAAQSRVLAQQMLAESRRDVARMNNDLAGDIEGLPVAQFGDSTRLRLGDVVLAIGNPFGRVDSDFTLDVAQIAKAFSTHYQPDAFSANCRSRVSAVRCRTQVHDFHDGVDLRLDEHPGIRYHDRGKSNHHEEKDVAHDCSFAMRRVPSMLSGNSFLDSFMFLVSHMCLECVQDTLVIMTILPTRTSWVKFQ
jgi:hypothetical protein